MQSTPNINGKNIYKINKVYRSTHFPVMLNVQLLNIDTTAIDEYIIQHENVANRRLLCKIRNTDKSF